jgi:hypothetical protein
MSRFLDPVYVSNLGSILKNKESLKERQRAKTSILKSKTKNNKRSLEKSLYSLNQ